MNRNLMGVFSRENDILGVTRACRERGYEIVDVYAPYPVHGLDRAMGLKPSRIPWLCFALGAFGATAMLAFQIWTSAVDWPANIGRPRPTGPLPPVPVVQAESGTSAGYGRSLRAGHPPDRCGPGPRDGGAPVARARSDRRP
jgi:hypothetical protein